MFFFGACFGVFLGKESSFVKTTIKYFCKKSMSKTFYKNFTKEIAKFFNVSFCSTQFYYRPSTKRTQELPLTMPRRSHAPGREVSGDIYGDINHPGCRNEKNLDGLGVFRQTASNHTKLSMPSRSPLDFGVQVPLDMSNGSSRRAASGHQILPVLVFSSWTWGVQIFNCSRVLLREERPRSSFMSLSDRAAGRQSDRITN
jgi:hypothetical protein